MHNPQMEVLYPSTTQCKSQEHESSQQQVHESYGSQKMHDTVEGSVEHVTENLEASDTQPKASQTLKE